MQCPFLITVSLELGWYCFYVAYVYGDNKISTPTVLSHESRKWTLRGYISSLFFWPSSHVNMTWLVCQMIDFMLFTPGHTYLICHFSFHLQNVFCAVFLCYWLVVCAWQSWLVLSCSLSWQTYTHGCLHLLPLVSRSHTVTVSQSFHTPLWKHKNI